MNTADSFKTLSGVAASLMRANIDTDTIIRIERLTNTKPEDTAAWLFEALRLDNAGRQDPAFVLNQPQFHDAPILLTGENFGCGSSREGAVWALKYAGIRCVIASSFGDIFANNCFQKLRVASRAAGQASRDSCRAMRWWECANGR